MDEGTPRTEAELTALDAAKMSVGGSDIVFLRDPGFDVMDALDHMCDDCCETNDGMDYWGELDPGALWRVEVKLS